MNEDDRFRQLFDQMQDGYGLHEIICDQQGHPIDYRFLDVNPAFERLTGLKAEEVIGRTAKEVLPRIEQIWIEMYGKVALSGEPIQFENYAAELDRFYSVTAYCPQPNHFACSFVDITERKQAEEKILSLSKFPEENPNPILRIGSDGRILFANQSSEPILKLWGRNTGENVPEDFRKEIQSASASGQNLEVELNCEDRIFSCVLTPVHGQSYLNIYGRDITVYKQAERTIRESESKYRALIETTETGFVIVDIAGRVLDANIEYVRLTGRERLEDILERNVLEWTAKHDLERNANALTLCIEQGFVRNLEIDYVDTDGSFTPVEIFATVYTTHAETVILSLTRDITERKRGEDTLRSFQKAVESSLDAIGMSTRDGRHYYQNEAFTKLFGLPVDQVHGTEGPASTLYADPAVGHEVFSTLMQGDSWEGMVTMLDKNRRKIEIALRAYAIKDDNGKVIGLVGVHTDFSERMRMMDALKQSLAQAEAATRAKSRFLANMSHEIRTPMTGLLGMASLLASSELNEKQIEYVRMMNQSGERLMRVINDILDIARIESGVMENVENTIGVCELVNSVLTPIANRARLKGLAFDIDLSNDIPDALSGDPTRIAQVLTNLADNAVKFTKAGYVRVRCALLHRSSTSAQIQFIVTDSGIGIPQDKIERIFEPFFQVDGSNSREYGGAGLGLSIARELTALMGGELRIESVPGKGTTCSLTLTMQIAGTDDSADRERKGYGFEPIDGHVLIAEDDRVSSILMNAFVRKLGLTADTVQSGQEVITMLPSGRYDLILMDCEMPGMNGYDTTRAIRDGAAGEAVKRIPIIAQTAYAMKDDRVKCIEAGMDDYISKPLDFDTLTAILKKWLPPR